MLSDGQTQISVFIHKLDCIAGAIPISGTLTFKMNKANDSIVLSKITEGRITDCQRNKIICLSVTRMKQVVILSCLLAILFACSSRHSKIIESYPDGKKKNEFVYKKEGDIIGDSLVNGQLLLFDSLGNLAQTDDYSGGKLNGKEIWYYPDGKIWRLTTLRNDSAIGFEYEFDDNGDTLNASVHYGLTVDGVFLKKWLPGNLVLNGSYGDSDRTYVVWKWIDKKGREVKQKIDSGILSKDNYKKFPIPNGL